jgi:hypothetical protein
MNKQQPIRRVYAYFGELPLKAHFVMNGNKCVKMSTRTAQLVEYGRTFYFGKRELCIVGEHSRLDAEYFNHHV